MSNRKVGKSASQPVLLGFSPPGTVEEVEEARSKPKEAWKSQSNLNASGTISHTLGSQMKFGNLLPQLDLNPVVGKISVGKVSDERAEQSPGEKKKR